jgi:hypothetical protein
MRGFVPFKSCLSDGAVSAMRLGQSIRKGTSLKHPVAGKACLRIAADTHGMRGGRPTLVELDRHCRVVDRLGLDVIQSLSSFGSRVSGDRYDISGDRGVQLAACGHLARAGRAVARSLSRRGAARMRGTGMAGGRQLRVVGLGNVTSEVSAFVFSRPATGSSEKDCNA